MSEPETFVARWSRRKRQAEQETEEKTLTPPPQPGTGAPAPAAAAGKEEGAETPSPAFDPASLPPIESITGDTDIRDFLRSGVPAELAKAALRRVWTADPAIRDFIGIAENQWDFTDPTAIPGFGPLQASDDVGKLVAQAMGRAGETAERLAEDDRAAGSGVQRNRAAAETAPSAAGVQDGTQEPVEPEENLRPPVTAEGSGEEQSRVDVAVQDARQAEKPRGLSNRRGHGSALPQ